MRKFDVFLSFKNSTTTGLQTDELFMAEELYNALSGHGISVFYSNETLELLGAAQYKSAIDSALDDAQILIAIGTSHENFSSSWVRYEWDSFYGDILSGQKQGQMFSYIDKISPAELPRTLRQLQSFDRQSTSVETICNFVKNALGLSQVNTPTIDYVQMPKTGWPNGSTYSYLDDKEKERLSIQAEMVYRNDVSIISDLLQTQLKSEKLSVLDLGCSDGYLTKRVFDNFFEEIDIIIGVDSHASCIEVARSTNDSSKYEFHQLDLESADWETELERIANSAGVEKFDFIFSALMFHHLNNPEKLLRKIRKYLVEDGVIYIRSCDDDEIDAYPDKDSLIRNTLKMTYEIEGMSDRIHGKKMYGQLYKSGYRNVQMKSYYVTTSDMSTEERQQLFFDIFYWRKNRYKKRLNVDPSNQKYLDELNEYCSNMETIEERFFDPTFYFRVAGPIAIAQK